MALGNTFAPTIFTASAKMRNPVGLAGPAGDLSKAIAVAGVILIAAAGLAAIVSLAFRYRRAGTTVRAQLKWLVYAAAVIAVAVLAQIPVASSNLQNAISIGAVALVPVAVPPAPPVLNVTRRYVERQAAGTQTAGASAGQERLGG